MSSDTLRERAYRHIQAKILSGDLAAGGRISEQSLAEEIGISRTPVRSAIRELEAEGLLEQVPRYGTIVKKADRRDLSELYDLRVALEGFAAETATDSITEEDLAALSELCTTTERLIEQWGAQEELVEAGEAMSRIVNADIEFHVTILKATGNRRLMKSVSESRMLSEWGHHARKPHRIDSLAQAWAGHRTIVQAFKSGDPQAARQAMVDHIRFSKRLALRIFDRTEAEGDAAAFMSWATPAAS